MIIIQYKTLSTYHETSPLNHDNKTIRNIIQRYLLSTQHQTLYNAVGYLIITKRYLSLDVILLSLAIIYH